MCYLSPVACQVSCATLTAKIPEEAKRIITGITDPNEAWKRLDERYGDKKIAVVAAMRDLTH